MHHNRVLVKQKVICTTMPSLFCLFFTLVQLLLLLLLRKCISVHIRKTENVTID